MKVLAEKMSRTAKRVDVKALPPTRGGAAESGLRFLTSLAEALHVYGTSADRLEEALTTCSRHLGLKAQFFATPTSIHISLETRRGALNRMIRVEGAELNLNKLDQVDRVMRSLLEGKVGPDAARLSLEYIRQAANCYPEWLRVLGFASASALVACLFEGGALEILLTAAIALVVGALSCLLVARERVRPLANVLSAALASSLAFSFLPGNDDAACLVTIASLILLMPGLKVTTAMRELAMQHLTAGSTRMVAAVGHLLGLAFGVALGKRLAMSVDFAPVLPDLSFLETPSIWLAMALTPLPFLIDYQMRLRDLPVVACGCFLAYLTSRAASIHVGPELGAFLGATAVGVGANIFSRTFNRPSSLMLIPGVTLLVPGSVGFRSVLALLDHDAMIGVETGFTMAIVGTALGSGLIVANILLPPRGAL